MTTFCASPRLLAFPILRLASPRINLQRLGFTGMHDPVATMVFGQPVHVDYTVVAGKFIVKEGHLVTLDTRQLAEKHTQAAKRLWQAS